MRILQPILPNLRVTAVSSPADPWSGRSVTVAWEVTNTGTAGTGAASWQDSVHLSTTTNVNASALLLGRVARPQPLDVNQGYAAILTATLPPDVSGSRYFIVQADADQQVAEGPFEGDNTRASAAVNVTLTPPPDLAVAQITIPATALAAHTVGLEYAVTNRGADTLVGTFWEDRVYLSASATLPAGPLDLAGPGVRYLGSVWHFDGLSAGTGYSNHLTVTLPEDLSGPWYAVVEADAAEDVFEALETNNRGVSVAPIQVESRPADLVVLDFTASAAGQAGGSLLASWTVRNQGTGPTTVARWRDRLVLSVDGVTGNGDDVTLLNHEQVGALTVGSAYSLSNRVANVPFTVAPGTYRLFLQTDAGNVVYEGANESNNASAGRPVTISRTTADLALTALSVAPLAGAGAGADVLPVLSEQPLLVSWRVGNAGTAVPNTSAWGDAVFLSTNRVWDTNAVRLGVSQNPVSPAPGEWYTNGLVVTLPAEIQGTHYVHLFADADGEVVEANRANNTLVATNRLEIGLRPVPDLAVVSVATPADGYSGQLFDLSWTVTNRGPAVATGPWFDAVYLSLDSQFEPDLDSYIGYAERSAALASGGGYTQTARLEIPREVSGLLHVFVVCNSTQILNERGASANNVGRSTTPVSIWLKPPSDLVVGTITIPANTLAGYEMALSYVLRNQGTNAAFGPWVDALYFSADDRWDLGDALFSRVSQSGLLSPGESRTNTVAAPAPGVIPGDYRVIIRTDLVNQVPETNESNNVTATLDRTATDVQQLVLGVPARDQLAHRQARYYRVHVAAGQWLVLELDCGVATAATELFIRQGAVPTRSEFDFIHSNPLQPDQRIVVPNTREGDYYVLVFGDFVPAPGTAAITLTARLSQFLVFDTTFGRGGNAGTFTIPINGVDLDRTCTARLTTGSTGVPAGVNRAAVNHYYDSSTRFWATLDLQGLDPGRYSVAVQNGDGSAVTLPDSLEVVAADVVPAVIPNVSAPNAMRRNVAYTFTVQWGNAGLNDAPAPLLTVGNTVPFGLNPGDTSLGTRYTFLGINTHGGPPGILRPGQTESLVFHAFSGTEAGEYTAFAERTLKRESESLDWGRVLSYLPRHDLERPDYEKVWSQFQMQIGATCDSYLAMLAHNANLLSPGMGSPSAEGDLVRLEWRKARAAQTPSISGQVLPDSLALDLASVQVVASATGAPQSQVVWCLTDGTFMLTDLDARLHSVEARSTGGRAPGPSQVDLTTGAPVSGLRLALHRAATIELEVTDVTGRPIAGAWAEARAESGDEVASTTDAHGVCLLSPLPTGFATVRVDAAGFRPATATVRTQEGLTSAWRIPLSPGAAILGVARLSTGEPAAGALVTAESLLEGWPVVRHGSADSQGRFQLTGLPAGDCSLHVAAAAAGGYSSRVTLSEGQSLELGQVTIPAGRGVARMGGSLDCQDYTGGSLALQARLALLEAAARLRLVGVLRYRGLEYASVVWEYLDNCFPNMPARHFGDGSDTVEGRVLGVGAGGDGSGTGGFGIGFRHHPTTRRILTRDLPGIIPVAFEASGLRVDAAALCGGGEQTFSLSDVLAAGYAGYRAGVGGVAQPQLAGPSIDYWTFSYTLAGGMGAYGMPHSASHPVFADQRLITGTLAARLVAPGRAQLVLRDVEFHVSDAFDFIPGNLGSDFMREAITDLLVTLEDWNYAYDIPVEVHWSYPGEEFPMGCLQLDELDCDPCALANPPADCDLCEQPNPPPWCDPCNGDNPPSFCDPCRQPDPPDSCKPTPRPQSVDPNDIVGPAGFGPERWILPDQTLLYTVRFENDPQKAEAPAQYVRITHPLSSNLDLRTFRLGGMAFGTKAVEVPAGRTYFRTQVNVTNDLGVVVDVVASLDLARGEVTWEFTSLDPATGDLPWDPYIGFLPPNTDGTIGQGFVAYTIKPKAGLTEGDVIDAEARIFFDYNEPMDTPRIFNTVDTSQPTSTVLPLPAVTRDNIFPVRWTGSDGVGGAGVHSYDVYASVDGGAWELWIQGTPYREQTFVGECGHHYSFRTVARDNVGHVGVASGAAEAQIEVLANTPPWLQANTNRVIAVGSWMVITNLAEDLDVPEQKLTYSLDHGAPGGMVIDAVTGILTWRPACLQGNQSYPVTVRVTDDGCGQFSTSETFTISVTECLQTSLGRALARVGTGACVPMYLESSDDLRSLTFRLQAVSGRYAGFSVRVVAPEVGTAEVASETATGAVVRLEAKPGTYLRGPKQLVEVCYTVLAGQPSAFVPLEIAEVLAVKANGEPLGNNAGQPGLTAVVGEEPLLECVRGADGEPVLILYGKPATGYAIQMKSDVLSGDWRDAWTRLTVPAGLFIELPLSSTGTSPSFYRAYRVR